MRILAIALLFLAGARAFPAAPLQSPEMAEFLDALARSSATFSRSVPHLSAREVLVQRARLANMKVLRKSGSQLKTVAFDIPDLFHEHGVVSEYSFGSLRDSSGFHEVRRILSIDNLPVTEPGSRHALSLGMQTPDDDTRKRLLEDLEHTSLQGSVVDFGPILLLFTKEKQSGFEFTLAPPRSTDSASVYGIRYHQISGSATVTEYRERTQKRLPFEGEVWLRQDNLLPLRITVRTNEPITKAYSLRNEAEIEYQPTPYGLAPLSVIHRQYVNGDLLVENRFLYTDYHGRTLLP